MSITLFELAAADRNIRFSPHCWKSRLALAHKQLAYQTEPVCFTEKDKIAFSNQPLVPVLQDGETVVNDSWEIAVYLDQQYPHAPSLLGKSEDQESMKTFCQWVDSHVGSLVRPSVIFPIYSMIREEDKDYFRTTREKKLGMSLEEINASASDQLKKLDVELQEVRELLSERNYLGGKQPNYKDICLMGTLLWGTTVTDLSLFADNDVMNIWYQDMLAFYADAMPKHLHAITHTPA